MELQTDRCLLRPFRPGDAPTLAHHANSYQIWRNLRDAIPRPYRLTDAEQYIALVADRRPLTQFAIEVDGAAAGSIGLKPGSDIERRSAEIGYWLGEEYWGRGIVRSAIAEVTAYGFRELDLVRVFAVPFVRNPASVRVLEHAGYQREGTMRCSAIKEGVVLDQYLYAAVRDDASGC